MLDEARRRVRSLVRLIERVRRNVVYSDFTDELGEVTELPALPGSGQVNGERFKAKVREFLRQHEDHIAVYKLRRNIPPTPTDLAELDRMLVETGEFDREKLDRAVEQMGSLGVLVRSLVGLDRSAACEALSAFLRDRTLNANQIEFIDMIVDSLTHNGVLTPAQLFEPPFSEIAPRGPDVIFPNEFVKIVLVLDEVRNRASAS